MIPVNALSATWAALAPLAQDIPDPSEVGTGRTGSIVLILLIVAVILLLLSLRKQLRKADRHFAAEDAERGTGKGGVIGDSDSARGEAQGDAPGDAPGDAERRDS